MLVMYELLFVAQRRLGVRAIWRKTKVTQVETLKRCLSGQVQETVSKPPEESTKSWRENPNLKYWVIGVGVITGVIYRYVYKEKEKRKVIVKNFPSLPSHKLHNRKTDLDEVYQLVKTSPRRSVTVVNVEGYPGSGKTLLARALAEKIAKDEEEKYYFFPRNMFIGTVNAVNVDTLLFDMKKFAIAIGCQTKDWSLRVDEGTQFSKLCVREQLHVIKEAIKEKLAVNPNWILIVDNLKDHKLFQELFDGDNSPWGKGTIIVTSPVKHSTEHNNTYSLDKGMEKHEAEQLLKDLTGLPEKRLDGSQLLLQNLNYSPFAIMCAGSFINSRLQSDADYSLKKFSDDLNSGFKLFMESNRSSNVSEPMKSSFVVASLLVKEALDASPHFLHAFDLIGSCSPDWPIPVSLISLHLRCPEYHLPPVPQSASVLPDLPEQGPVESTVKPSEEVQESFLSIKRLASNLESFTKAVKANYDAIKEMFNPPPLDLSPPSDGVLELMKTCPFVTAEKINPGGVQTIRVNSMVHQVMCQLFNTNTAPLLEKQHLIRSEERHNNSSWFRRLWEFDAQRSLQEYRKRLGEKNPDDMPLENTPLDPNTVPLGVNVSSLLRDNSDNSDLPSYRSIEPVVASDHYQHHIGLVLKTVSGVSSVCSQDIQTRTLARLLMPHLHHIVNTSRSLGPKSCAHALLAEASINSALGSLDASVPSLEEALSIEEVQFGASSLEVASTLTRLAEVYSSLDDAIKARKLLERAYGIYEQRKKSGEYKEPLEFARTMEALGAVYGALGFKQQSRDYIERALSYMQAAAPTTPDEIEGRRFTCEVASTLADLGHAYLSVGDAFSGRKMLELAVTGLKNMYGEEHPEVVRALTILGTAYTMQGNWQEGKKMRKEAGKIQAKLDAVVAL